MKQRVLDLKVEVIEMLKSEICLAEMMGSFATNVNNIFFSVSLIYFNQFQASQAIKKYQIAV